MAHQVRIDPANGGSIYELQLERLNLAETEIEFRGTMYIVGAESLSGPDPMADTAFWEEVRDAIFALPRLSVKRLYCISPLSSGKVELTP